MSRGKYVRLWNLNQLIDKDEREWGEIEFE